MSLADKIRKSRETKLDVGGYKLRIRRPSDIEASSMTYETHREAIEGILPFVIGWDDVKEIDLIAGGAPDPVPFEQEIFREWIYDQPTLWAPLVDGVLAAYKAHRERMEAKGNA